MKRLSIILLALLLLVAACACSQALASTRDADPLYALQTAVPTPTPVPETLTVPDPPKGWAEAYITFIKDNYDIFAALWPEGLTGAGFIDLDLDGTPEMAVFDLGASATMGVQLFDLVDGQVYCVSSVQEDAAGAFGDEHFSKVSVCASFFESFRLSRTEEGFCFWVDSANGTLESAWDEIVRFDCVDGVLTPVSVCARYLESDVDTGLVVAEDYTVAGEPADAAGYDAAAKIYLGGKDLGYDAKGIFLWSDMKNYDTTYDGFIAMAEDAAKLYEAPAAPENDGLRKA